MGDRFSPARRPLIASLKSGMLDSGNQADRLYEFPPAIALRRENLPPGRGQAVITPSPLPGLLHPTAANPAALLQPVEERVKRSDVEAQCPARPEFNQLPNFIAVPLPVFHQGKN